MENETSLSSYACYGGSSEHITSESAKSVKKINKVQIAKMIAVVLTIAVWILLSLPTVFYQLRQKDKVRMKNIAGINIHVYSVVESILMMLNIIVRYYIYNHCVYKLCRLHAPYN